MKRIIIALLILGASQTFAQVKNGDQVPELAFNVILNAPVKSASISQLKGKIVLIDFWATWCGSCLVAMPHLKALQQKYPHQLQIITVTDETPKRTMQFLKSKPSNLWFAVDTGRVVAGVFPHSLIPHSILISPDGKLIAATDPEAITYKVIDSLLNKKTVHLPEKRDNLLTYQELIKQNFYAADTVKSRFMMQGEIKGGPGLSTTYLDDKVFSGRRLTCINLPLTTLYMLAYGNFPYSRLINNTGDGKNAPRYCLDLIVQNKSDLKPELQRELAKRFDLQAKTDSVLKDVQVLRIADQEKFKLIPRNKTGKPTYYARHGEIDQQDIDMFDFAEFLESYGIGKLVVDETANKDKLDIKFSFQPENPQTLTDILTGMGLSLTKEQKKVNMLVLYKQQSL